MGKLRLTLHLLRGTTSVDLTPGEEGAEVSIAVSETKKKFKLNLTNLSFKKKMYQPTEMTADLHLNLSEGQTGDWASLEANTVRKDIESMFKHRRVSLAEVDDKGKVGFVMGDDYYVHEVVPRLMPSALYVTLRIYSLDKLLTLRKASRTWVAKRLGDQILKKELSDKNYLKPYTVKIENGKPSGDPLQCNYKHMKQLKKSGGNEHIHPYLVQYNESFYDMLARTCNRWGEFLYWEDGRLNIGYDTSDANRKTLGTKEGDYQEITFFDLNTTKPVVSEAGKYDRQADMEKHILTNLLEKSPNEMSGLMFYPNGKFDKVVMKKLAAFFKNDKSLPTFIGNQLFDDSLAIAESKIKTNHSNNEFDETYFGDPDENKNRLDVQYGDHDFGKDGEKKEKKGLNQFSELNAETTYGNSQYGTILGKEQTAGRNAIRIDMDTAIPNMKLGNILTVHGSKYIVVEINGHQVVKKKYKIQSGVKVVEEDPETKYVFEVIGIACEKEEIKDANKKVIGEKETDTFFPYVIESGHVRYADPQIATITDADDPSGKNMVRVMFGWQSPALVDEKKPEKGYTDETKTASSPWLQFTTGADGQPTVGLHYAGNKVMVGFIDGNIERPYILGGLEAKGSDEDVIRTTPGGHKFTMNDDPNGLTSFLTGMLYPGIGTISKFVPSLPGKLDSSSVKNSRSLGGGFELSDNYGIYKITGSTDGREVAIASPWGEVNINAFTGISISAPNGDISIKGKNVKIEAGNNLELVSGSNVEYKLMGGSASGFFMDVATAVAKKLLEMGLSLIKIDLSVIRAVLEIAMRPTEGKLLVKSNRYLMLESGKGSCDYPAAAYKDEATVAALVKAAAAKDLRPGLKLQPAVVEIVEKVGSVSDEIRSHYIAAYENMRSKLDAFNQKQKDMEYLPWCKGYQAGNELKVCKSYTELKDTFWKADKDMLKDEDLGFTAAVSKEKADVDQALVTKFTNDFPLFDHYTEDQKKQWVVDNHIYFRELILKAANALRQAIIDFNATLDLKEDTVKQYCGKLSKSSPAAFKKALLEAFAKKEHTDVIFFKEADGTVKNLDALNLPDTQLKALKRKAAMLTLEKIGFKDEWRQKVTDPTWVQAHPNPTGAQLLSAPKVLAAPRPASFADLTTQQTWENYVNSLASVPKLTADKWKITKELTKSWNSFKDNYKGIIDQVKENRSWGEAKKGAILFSSGADVYGLGGNIELVDTPWKENLTAEDDAAAGNRVVETFLNEVKAKLKALN